jgi:hypothetical protein
MGKVTTALHILGALRAMPVTNALRVLVTVALETAALLVMLGALAPAHAHPAASMPPDAAFEATDRLFENYSLDAHVPGLVYGIVADGRLVHVRAFGVQDLETRRPITADSLFRIALMTKDFTWSEWGEHFGAHLRQAAAADNSAADTRPMPEVDSGVVASRMLSMNSLSDSSSGCPGS